MVEFNDGAVLAQMSYPDMELAIQLALSYPERLRTDVKSLDFATLKTLSFEEVDKKKYPCFDIILQSAKTGGPYPAVANGANEECVRLFLQGKISYSDIYKGIYGALQSYDAGVHAHYDDLVAGDEFARKYVLDLFKV